MIAGSALEGQRVVVTRPRSQAGGLVEALEAGGAEAVCVPTIRFAPPDHPPRVDAALGRLDAYDWVCFTSQNGVAFAGKALERVGKTTDAFRSTRLAAVGPATRRALEAENLDVAFVPSPYLTRELGRQLPDVQRRRVLLLRAQVASPGLTEELRGRRARVDDVAVYQTVPDPSAGSAVGDLTTRGADWILFTSPSTVAAFAELFEPDELRRLQRGVPAAAIGPVTAKAAEEHGFSVAACADKHTAQGLLEALVREVGQRA